MPTVGLIFELRKGETKPGEILRVTGSCEELGNWARQQGHSLELRTGPKVYPLWTMLEPLCVRISDCHDGPLELEYKYVKDPGPWAEHGQEVAWEEAIPNRRILVPQEEETALWIVSDVQWNQEGTAGLRRLSWSEVRERRATTGYALPEDEGGPRLADGAAAAASHSRREPFAPRALRAAAGGAPESDAPERPRAVSVAVQTPRGGVPQHAGATQGDAPRLRDAAPQAREAEVGEELRRENARCRQEIAEMRALIGKLTGDPDFDVGALSACFRMKRGESEWDEPEPEQTELQRVLMPRLDQLNFSQRKVVESSEWSSRQERGADAAERRRPVPRVPIASFDQRATALGSA